jgi:hypothetical protein
MSKGSLFYLSLVANVLLLIATIILEGQYQMARSHSVRDVAAWADYAGIIQAEVDYGTGVHRLYQPMLVDDQSKPHFTGETNVGVEVWLWTYRPESGDAGKASAEAYTDAYNRTMRKYLKDPASYTKNELGTTQPSE